MIPQALTNYTIFQTFANFTASGDNLLIPGLAGYRIAVIQFRVISGGAVAIYFESNTTPITSTSNLTQGGFGGVYSPIGHFATAAGQSLQINLSSNVAIGVDLAYIFY